MKQQTILKNFSYGLSFLESSINDSKMQEVKTAFAYRTGTKNNFSERYKSLTENQESYKTDVNFY